MSKQKNGQQKKKLKSFIQKYQKNLIKKHIMIAILTLVIGIGLLYIQDALFNGRFIDFVTKQFGYSFALNLIISKNMITLCICFGILLIGFIIVEMRANKKLGKVLNDMYSFLGNDDNFLKLDQEFKDLEIKFNELKLNNIRNEQLAQIETQRKNDLIAYLAHDIRTPLSSVIGYLSLLDETKEMSPEQQKKYTKITLDKACRVEQLINEFFDITRFNVSSITLQKERIPLQFMLAQIADEFYPMLENGNHTIEVNVEDNLYIEADPDKIARVFNNIIKNAIAYSYNDTPIMVTAFRENKHAIVTIKDKGTMIPKENLRMIFDKFYRLDEARSTNTGGAGLGLAIAKEIVLAHDGEIVVTSNECETCFTIKLPL